MIPACKLDCCDQSRGTCPDPSVCQTEIALPPVIEWLRREIAARSQLWRWYATNRKAGFSRRRSLVLAWRTTRPVRRAP